ncbi:MAG: HlyD family efflux transporter periplasmic adaptor subunit [Acidobacteriota bacterium]|nr:HlyD family efflux transporter periplasmic adaptor subunit [Acidobacteriota bacterium]
MGKTIVVALAALAVSLCAACTSLRQFSGLGESERAVPSAKVVRAPVETEIHVIGELRPSQTAMITAPPAGSVLQIIQIVDAGVHVREGDVIVAFDPSEQEYALEQSRFRLEEAEQQIRKMKADQAVRVAQEQVSLLGARYAVERAEWKVKGNDLLSAIEARKNVIAMEEARRRFEQLERDIQSRASSDAAELQGQEVVRDKAVTEMATARQLIDNMVCRAPISGIVILGQNLEALISGSGGISISSETVIPLFKQGDQAYPGRMIAQIQALEQMEIAANVLETDVANMEQGQAVKVRLDSNPLETYQGRLKSVAESSLSANYASTTADYLEALSTRSFAAVFEVTTDHTLMPGGTAQIAIPGKSAGDVLSVPRHALRQKGSETFLYVRSGDGWKSQTVRIQYLTESRAVIEGVAEGTEVALGDPGKRKGKAASGKGTPMITGEASAS